MCDVKDDLIRRMAALRDELDASIKAGISDSTYDRLDRMLVETDERLGAWYETHDDCQECIDW